MLSIGSLFSGAGGLDMAVEAALGGRTVWQCEIDPAASKVLAHRWPGVPNVGDISGVDWARVHPVDVLCGGFPCQDVSAAGRRAGIKDGTRSGLWAVYADAIAKLRPAIVVIENVRGLLSADGEPWPDEVQQLNDQWRSAQSELILYREICAQLEVSDSAEDSRLVRQEQRALARFNATRKRLVQRAIGTVIADLADLGYDAQWTTLAASSVGAPHQRERVFILATDTQRDRPRREADDARGRKLDPPGGCGRSESRRPGTSPQSGSEQADGCHALPGLDLLPTPAAARSGRNQSPSPGAAVRPSLDMITDLLPTPSTADGNGGHLSRSGERGSELLLPGLARAYGNGDLLPTPATADADRGPDFAREHREGSGGDDLVTLAAKASRDNRWGKYADAIHRWESVTRVAPSPTEPNSNGNPRLAAAFSEWMLGWPLGWVTEVAEVSRNDQLRIVGNGVCPQQAHAAIRSLLSVAYEAVA